ncbi:hypothetical protein BsWGS_01525 [Bradybaena similaris]
MLLHKCVISVLFGILAVECAIFSHNNKYSSKQTLLSIDIDNGVIDITRNRVRRDALAPTTTTQRSQPSTTPKATVASSAARTTVAPSAAPSSSTTPARTTQSSAAAKSTTTTAAASLSKPTVVPGGEAEIEVHPFVLNGTQRANQAFVHWIGKGTSEHIFILTCTLNVSDGSRSVIESQLWRSDNYGTSFKEIKFDPGAKISYFYVFAQNEKKLLFTDVSAKKIYVTKDELNTKPEVTSVPVEPDIVLPHPTDENKILIYSLDQRKLYVSTDFAENWNLLCDNVLPNFYWGVKDVDQDVDIVHMEVEAGMPTQANYKICRLPDCKNSGVDDFGPFMADSLVVHKEYIFVQKSSYLGSDSYLMVSYNRKPFKRAFFPGDLKTDDFMLLNLDDGQVFIAVNHGDYVNLYLSEVTGQYYVLSFTNIYHIMRLDHFEIDFHEVQSMNWTFLANKREPNGVKTYISFDKGGNWAPLTLNRSCTVEETCSLLLEVKQSALTTSMLSQVNAPGVIVAHGIVGTNFHGQETNVFTSSDGGATWLKALNTDGTPLVGRFRFNFLDQGGVLTAVPDGLVTGFSNKTVFYSWDDGKHWQKQDFDSAGLIVKGVLTEPGSLTMVASVFGHEGIFKPWTVIKLDFSKTLPVKCESKDYDNWIPKDYNSVTNNTCILGQVVAYKRRSPASKCFNGEVAKPRIQLNITCECTSEDYECDFGYEEKKDTCQKATWFDESYTPSECDKSGMYNKSQGYRKIPADICVENKSDQKKYGKMEAPCQSAAPSKLSIVLQSRKLPAGKEVTFHLEQAGGSKFDSKYTWDFGDGSKPEEETGFQNASIKKHIFKVAGHYNVNVTVENVKGKKNTSTQIHVQYPLVSVYLLAPLAGKIGVPMTFNVIPTSASRLVETSSDHVHFVWTFGDGNADDLPVLTWNSSVTHVFDKAGTYRMSVEAVNSLSSVYKEQLIQIFDDAEILVLTFSSNVDKYRINPVVAELFTLRIKQQLAEDLGVNMRRLEAVIISTTPTTAHLFVFPSTAPDDESVASIRDKVISQTKKGVLGVNLFGKNHEAGEIISIVSAENLSQPGRSSGPNMKAVYIAAPVLVLVVIVSIVSFFYCRKKLQNLHQYNILHTQDDSDALLDDDEAPLDLNVDFATRQSSRDDGMLDVGGSHLVLVTGGGSSDNAENC